MGLNVALVVGGETPEAVEHRVGAARYEARRHHRLDQLPAVAAQGPHEADEVGRLRDPDLGGGIPVVVGALLGIIHGDPADEGALALLKADLGQRLGGLQVNGGEVQRRRGAVGQQGVDQPGIDPAGKVRVGVARLQGKGVLLQPLVERQMQGLAGLRPLRGVDVEIDKARQQDLRGRER
jgi:hypothetical protein